MPHRMREMRNELTKFKRRKKKIPSVDDEGVPIAPANEGAKKPVAPTRRRRKKAENPVGKPIDTLQNNPGRGRGRAKAISKMRERFQKSKAGSPGYFTSEMMDAGARATKKRKRRRKK